MENETSISNIRDDYYKKPNTGPGNKLIPYAYTDRHYDAAEHSEF
jgi:hypothetical protein